MSARDDHAGDVYAEKLRALDRTLRSLGRVAVAFSGGVDSSVLLHAAHRVLGNGAVAVIADSPSLPRRELDEARSLAASIGVRLEVIATDEMEDERYVENAGRRCYFCKSALFRAMEPWARAQGFDALAFGEITDDWSDDRPGARAAKEWSVVAPLSQSGFGKDDVRRYAREHGLVVAEKPSSACLASRLPIGTRVTREKLASVERCEEILRELGFVQRRVRDLGTRARVEVGPDELERALALEPQLRSLLSAEGFAAIEITAYGKPAAPVTR